MANSMLTHDTESPNPKPPNKHEARPQGQRLNSITRTADPRVKHDIQLITHRIGIDDYQAGFDAMRSGNSGKVVMDW